MEKELIYKEKNINGEVVLIKTLESFEDFKDGIRIFCAPPYNEILTDKDCEDEYLSYVENGIVFGCYVDQKLAGLNCILNEVHKDYSISFYDNSKIAYYSGLAVKPQFRRQGLGKLLVANTEFYLEKLNKYDYTFARILCEGSMSEGIFKQNDFKDAYYNGELIVDDVTYDRNDPNVLQSDKRKYMVKTLNNTAKGWYKK